METTEKTIDQKLAEIKSINASKDQVERDLVAMDHFREELADLDVTLITHHRTCCVDLPPVVKTTIIDLIQEHLAIRKKELFEQAQQLMK